MPLCCGDLQLLAGEHVVHTREGSKQSPCVPVLGIDKQIQGTADIMGFALRRQKRFKHWWFTLVSFIFGIRLCDELPPACCPGISTHRIIGCGRLSDAFLWKATAKTSSIPSTQRDLEVFESERTGSAFGQLLQDTKLCFTVIAKMKIVHCCRVHVLF